VNWFKSEISYEEQTKIWSLRSIFGDKKLLNFLFLISNNFKRKNKVNDTTLSIIRDGLQKGEGKDAILNKILDLGITDSQIVSYIRITPTPEDFILSNPELSEFIDVLTDDTERNNRLESLGRNKESIEFKNGVVNLMTIHKSKGLQSDYVFVIGLVEGILPNETKGIDSTESQRRELFVALSRVREKLFLISTTQIDKTIAHKFDVSKFMFDYKTRNFYFGQTSLFVNELKLDKKAYL
jgi:superfamily I DNA/RNA helicase